MLSSLEICAGAGGQALGLEMAGFQHEAIVEIDADCCKTLALNRPGWTVINQDVRSFSGAGQRGIDLLAGGVPCPPFSLAGKQLGTEDERDLFPEAIRLIDEARPKAVLLENVKGLLSPSFEGYRRSITSQIERMGYWVAWRLLNASDYSVPQLRPRVVMVALEKGLEADFEWPVPGSAPPPSVGEALHDLMAADGWLGAAAWKHRACQIAPTLVGGSKKHGGPDLGPTRARAAWAALGVDGRGLADAPPGRDFVGMPRLTNRMAARVQAFPDSWAFHGRKTSAYRQIGNAFPPPVAMAVGESLRRAVEGQQKVWRCA